VRFTDARLQDPQFVPVPRANGASLGETTVTAGQPLLHFSLKPSIGTRRTRLGPIRGFITYPWTSLTESTHEPFTTILQPREINVGGRCGTNVPFPEAVFTASSVQAGTLIGIDATTSSDADNDPLTFLPQQRHQHRLRTPTAADICLVPGDQAFGFGSGCPASVPGPAQFTFTPDLPAATISRST